MGNAIAGEDTAKSSDANTGTPCKVANGKGAIPCLESGRRRGTGRAIFGDLRPGATRVLSY